MNINEINMNNFPRIIKLTHEQHDKLTHNLSDRQFFIVPIYKEDNKYYSLLDNIIFEIYKMNFKKLICVDYGEINIQQAKLIYLQSLFLNDNFDTIGVSKLICDIKDIYNDNDLINSLPFDSKYIDMFKNLLDFNWEDYNVKEDEDFNISFID